MLPAASSERVRVGVLGDSADARDWLDGFASPAMELLHVRDVATLLGSGVDRAVVFASPTEAARISAELAQQPGAPPVTIFVNHGDNTHPEVRVARAVLQAKREWETTFDALVDPLALAIYGLAYRTARLPWDLRGPASLSWFVFVSFIAAIGSDAARIVAPCGSDCGRRKPTGTQTTFS